MAAVAGVSGTSTIIGDTNTYSDTTAALRQPTRDIRLRLHLMENALCSRRDRYFIPSPCGLYDSDNGLGRITTGPFLRPRTDTSISHNLRHNDNVDCYR
jgi:hypothetical protein